MKKTPCSLLSIAWLVSALLLCPLLAVPPVVSNVSGVQRPGTKLVDITYNVADPDSASLTISLLVSTDAGVSWSIPTTGSSGAIGSGITPGTGKVIVWDAGANWNNNYTTTARYRITAEDGTILAPPGFSWIPPGLFTMGDQSSPKVGAADEVVHTVNVSAFYMAKTETTYGQWVSTKTYAAANGYTFTNAGAGKANDHPVQTVSWYDVVKWCNAKSEQDGLQPCYTVSGATYKTGNSTPVCDFTKNGYRLPTEAEWEKAARGGQTALNFPWGNTITHSQANYYSSTSYAYDISPTRNYHPTYGTGSQPYTNPAGAFTGNANGYGLFDMTGNVWEWCWDWYGTYPAAGGTDYRGATSGSYRVYRGGGWGNNAYYGRVAYRYLNTPTSTDYGIGFRLARGSF